MTHNIRLSASKGRLHVYKYRSCHSNLKNTTHAQQRSKIADCPPGGDNTPQRTCVSDNVHFLHLQDEKKKYHSPVVFGQVP